MDQFKICMLGEYHAGKTSLVYRFIRNEFDEQRKSSLGVRIDRKPMNGNAGPMELIIWDMAGANKYQQVQTSYLRHASAYVLVIDGTRKETAAAALDVHEKAQATGGTLPYVLVVNKCDAPGFDVSQAASQPAWQALAENALAVVSTSAMTGSGVNDAFDMLANTLQQQLACAA